MRWRLLLQAALVVGFVCNWSMTPVTAQVVQGGYVLGGAGLQQLRDSQAGGTTHGFEPGWAGIAGLGYGLGNGVRLEGELGYRRSPEDNTGTMSAWSLMGNALYDFDLKSRFTPYAGVGLGAARLKADGLPVSGSTLNDSDTVLAYQGLAGVGYALDGNLKLDFGYRYFATEEPSFTDRSGRSFDSEFRDHTVLMTLRYEFR